MVRAAYTPGTSALAAVTAALLLVVLVPMIDLVGLSPVRTRVATTDSVESPTRTAGATASASPSLTAAATGTPAETAAPTETPTLTPLPSLSSLPSPSAPATPSSSRPATPSRTLAPSLTAAATRTPAATASGTAATTASLAPLPLPTPVTRPDAVGRAGDAAAERVCGTDPSAPPLTGTFDLARPPYFFPKGCAIYGRNATQARACLAGRRIFVLGNSVARAYVFELPTVLDAGGREDRAEQKRTCSKMASRGTQAQHATSCALDFVGGGRVSFLWRQVLGEVAPDFPIAAEGEFCFNVTARECHAAFFDGSRPGDVLLITQGLLYARYPKQTLGAAIPGRDVLPPDIDATLARDANVLVSHVRELFRGSHIIAVNTAPMVKRSYEDTFVDEWPLGTNARAQLINARLKRVWDEQGWPVIDQRAMNVIAVDAVTSEKCCECVWVWWAVYGCPLRGAHVTVVRT